MTILTFDAVHVEPMRGALTLQCTAGQHIAVVGPIGSGKSELLRTAVGASTNKQGNLWLNHVNLRALDAVGCARHGVSYAPQVGGAFGDLSAIENLRLAWESASSRRKRRRWRDALAAAVAVMPALELFLRRYARDLSGGQLRIVSIIRAWIVDPIVLVLDEPLNGLDAAARRQVHSLIDEFCRGGGIAIGAYQSGDAHGTAHVGVALAPDSIPMIS